MIELQVFTEKDLQNKFDEKNGYVFLLYYREQTKVVFQFTDFEKG